MPRRQRGAVGLFGILTLLLLLLFTALAVDSGRLWFEKRKLQSVADLAAIEAASRLGCGRDSANVVSAAQTAAKRNGYEGDLSNPPNLVEVGGLVTDAGQRQFVAGAGSHAVHVVATKAISTSLVLGGVFGNDTLVSAEATARAEPPQATFSAGSYLLRVSATEKDANLLSLLLGGLLGSSLSLDALSYKGLASTNVNLAQLVKASATVGSVEELLAADLSVADVIGLTATAVSQQSVLDLRVTAALQTLLSASLDRLDVRLADVLDVSAPASEAAAKVGINVLDLVTATILVANKDHAVSLPLAVNLGKLINVNANVHIVAPPRIAVGAPGVDDDGLWCTQARTAQLDVKTTVKVDLNLLGLLPVLKLDLALGAQLAQGVAHLEDLDIVPGATRAVIGATPGIASLLLTNIAGTDLASLSLLGIPVAEIGLNLPIQPGSSQELVYDVDSPVDEHLPQSQSVASSIGASLANALAEPGAIELKVLGVGLGPILDPLLGSLLSPLLGFIGSAVVDPLLKLLGIQVGGLDVDLQDIEYKGVQLVI